MEKLRRSIDTQERYLNLIAGSFLKHLNATMESYKSSKKPVPLAHYTRHFRLGRILQVLEDLVMMENQLYSWYAGLESHDPNENDMHNEVHETIQLVERETRHISKEWGESEGFRNVKSSMTGNYSHLEKRIARLHDSVEAMLTSLKNLVSYLTLYNLLPLHDRMLETVKFYGGGFIRTDQQTLNLMRTKSLKAKKNSFSMLDVPKINLLIMSLPQKYILAKTS